MIFHGVRIKSCLLAALTSLSICFPVSLFAQRGALVKSRNLGELVSQSATIVRGSIISTRVEPHPELSSLYTVVVTLRVQETMKGDAGNTLTFRQFLWDVRDRYDAAVYRKGDDVLLLLNPVTRYGLTSPAGLDQGLFRISRDALGREVAANGRRNAGLLHGMAQQIKSKRVQLAPPISALVNKPASGPMELQSLRELIRGLNAPPGN